MVRPRTKRKHSLQLTIMYAQEKVGIDGWQPYFFSVDPDKVPPGFMNMRGKVPGIYKIGPKKGQVNWNTGDPTTERIIFVSDNDAIKYAKEWERSTGRCPYCMGEGRIQYRWGKETGALFKDCEDCDGTGVSKEFPENFTPIQKEVEDDLFASIT